MDENTVKALHRSQGIDLTTNGRRSGRRRKTEILLHDDDGLPFVTGMPRADRTRDWIHNIAADPQVVVHLKKSMAADLPATARVVTDPAQRRPLMEVAAQRWGRTDVDEMVERHCWERYPLALPAAGCDNRGPASGTDRGGERLPQGGNAFGNGDRGRLHLTSLTACADRAFESRHKEGELEVYELLLYLELRSG